MLLTHPTQHQEPPSNQTEEGLQDLLRAELKKLAEEVQHGGHRKNLSSQMTTRLAALLVYVQQNAYFRSWGFSSLSRYACEELGLKEQTLDKYKRAGKALFENYPRRAQQLLESIRSNTERPHLPKVSKLEAMGRLSRDPRRPAKAGFDALQMDASLRVVRSTIASDMYGDATPAEINVLRPLDQLVRDLNAGLRMLEEGVAPSAQVDTRIDEIAAVAERLWYRADQYQRTRQIERRASEEVGR